MAKPYTWDLFVRVTHWLVAALFLANFLQLKRAVIYTNGLAMWLWEPLSCV